MTMITAPYSSPPLTHQLWATERRQANHNEALQLVRHQLGDVPLAINGVPTREARLVESIATALWNAEDRGPKTPRVVPVLIEVTGHPHSEGTIHGGNDPDWLPREADGPEQQGLKCPWCGAVTWDGDDYGIYVIDVSERWSRFGYQVSMEDEQEPYDAQVPQYEGGPLITVTKYRPTGRQVEVRAVVGGYADSDHQGEAYACETCSRRVALPDGVEEQGN
jgi:hypothetical protein